MFAFGYQDSRDAMSDERRLFPSACGRETWATYNVPKLVASFRLCGSRSILYDGAWPDDLVLRAFATVAGSTMCVPRAHDH
jgi:hypothetical protein